MRKITFICFNFIFIVSGFCQTYTDKKGNVHLWGEVSVNDLKKEPYKDWFEKNSTDYESNLTISDGLLFQGVKAKIYIGTWCGDTKYLVPKFLKTWAQMGLDEHQLEIIALHNEGDLYKQGPNKETLGKNIHKVPTFIFEKDGTELGRIVERTIFDLDTDMMQIVKGNPYEERYQAVVILNQLMKELPDDSLFIKENLNTVYKKVRREVSNSSELNAYGYVLKAQGELKKAEFVFLLNRYLFPYTPNVRDSYGEILIAQERYEEAKTEYEEVIRLKGSDENAIKQLNLIYSKLEETKVANE